MEACGKIRAACQSGFSLPAVTAKYGIYAGLLECSARLASWTHAVRSCESDADRYLRGAQVAAGDTSREFKTQLEDAARGCISFIGQITAVDEVPAVYTALLSIPLAISDPLPPPKPRVAITPRIREAKPKIIVAFTLFSLDGKGFQRDQLLSLDLLYDLEVEIRVSSWPGVEAGLVLEPLSVEPADSYELPSFSFGKPPGEPPYTMRALKRMVLKRASSFLARPLEFSYRARFSPPCAELITEGQRHLTARCYDSKKDPLSGYEQVDRRLAEIRDTARRAPGISDSELNNLLVLMAAVGGIAGQALQDDLFPGTWNEEMFQSEMKGLLRSRPKIGSELEEHPQVSGGITDLSFGHIRLELKAISDHYVNSDDFAMFLPQIVQYVSGSDRRFGVLCILDTSPKKTPSGSVADDIGYEVWPAPSGAGLPIGIGTVIIRGNLAKPSSLKGKRRRGRS